MYNIFFSFSSFFFYFYCYCCCWCVLMPLLHLNDVHQILNEKDSNDALQLTGNYCVGTKCQIVVYERNNVISRIMPLQRKNLFSCSHSLFFFSVFFFCYIQYKHHYQSILIDDFSVWFSTIFPYQCAARFVIFFLFFCCHQQIKLESDADFKLNDGFQLK